MGAPVDRRAPELDALDARAAAGLRGGEWFSRGLGEGEVGDGGYEEEDKGEGDEGAAAAGVGWPAKGEGERGRSHPCLFGLAAGDKERGSRRRASASSTRQIGRAHV